MGSECGCWSRHRRGVLPWGRAAGGRGGGEGAGGGRGLSAGSVLSPRKECLVSSSGNDNTENGLAGSKAEQKAPPKA